MKSEALQQALSSAGVKGLDGVTTPPPPPILLQAAKQQQQKQQQQASPKAVAPPATAPSPAPSPTNSDSPSSHFNCEGCGIKFKSGTNLQAHQARYCAGLRKNDEMRAFEALLKRSQQQQQQQQQPPLALPQQPSPLAMSAADMMTFLNAKSMEQQAKAAAAVAVATASASASANSSKGTDDKRTSSPSPLQAAPPTPHGGGAEDFCCILCGYKEQSVEKLKDHINMHFIGQVKKGNGSANNSSPAGEVTPPRPPAAEAKSPSSPTSQQQKDPSSNPSPPLKKRIKLEFDKGEDGQDVATVASEPRRKSSSSANKSPPAAAPSPATSIRCEPCDIGFAQISNFLAHKKYYCQSAKAAAAAEEEAMAAAAAAAAAAAVAAATVKSKEAAVKSPRSPAEEEGKQLREESGEPGEDRGVEDR